MTPVKALTTNRRLTTTGSERATGDELFLVGVSFRTAGAALRNAMSMGAQEVQVVLEAAAADSVVAEAAVLSTCNRTEFYLVSSDPEAPRLWQKEQSGGTYPRLSTHRHKTRGNCCDTRSRAV